MKWEQSFYEAALSQPCINTHCHIDFAEPPIKTLPDFFRKSYLNWQFKHRISSGMDIGAFLDFVSCNSYFYLMAKALGELYSADHTPLNRQNWEEIQQGLAASNQNPHKLEEILVKKCGYQAIIADIQNNPGGDNGRPELFRPAFRCDMFIKGHPQAGQDLNGNTPQAFLPVWGELSFDAYLEAIRQAIQHKIKQGAVALKLAIAYERGLDFREADDKSAQKVWNSKCASLTEIKAFEDTVAFHLCQAAGEFGIPVQIHTGMGKLERSNALWLKPLLDAHPNTKFVLLHCSYPHTADTMALLHEYNNVYADLSWLPLLSPNVAASVLDEALDISDAGRIAWGCDAETLEESLGVHDMFCQILAQVLGRKLEKGYYSADTCRRLISEILLNGPAALYGLNTGGSTPSGQ